MSVYRFIFVKVCMHVFMYLRTYVGMYYTCMYVYACLYSYVCFCGYICMNVYVCICVHLYVSV